MGMFLFIVLLIALWQGVYWFGVEVFAVFKSYSVPSPMGVPDMWQQYLLELYLAY